MDFAPTWACHASGGSPSCLDEFRILRLYSFLFPFLILGIIVRPIVCQPHNKHLCSELSLIYVLPEGGNTPDKELVGKKTQSKWVRRTPGAPRKVSLLQAPLGQPQALAGGGRERGSWDQLRREAGCSANFAGCVKDELRGRKLGPSSFTILFTVLLSCRHSFILEFPWFPKAHKSLSSEPSIFLWVLYEWIAGAIYEVKWHIF